MATSGYSEDLQPQQANTVTIATPAATTPSSVKPAHFLSEIPPSSGMIASANQSATGSKKGQDARCSQAPPTQAQSQKAVVLTTPTQHYVATEIQKSNGQNSSPQYIIVTVTGECTRNESNTVLFSSPMRRWTCYSKQLNWTVFNSSLISTVFLWCKQQAGSLCQTVCMLHSNIMRSMTTCMHAKY